jgi:hypothetical protein
VPKKIISINFLKSSNGKIAVEKDLNKTMASISSSLAEIGEHLILDNYGDSLHYKPR